MFKQDHQLQTRNAASISLDDLRHVLIPACELGAERYHEFRAANPQWRPRPFAQPSGQGLHLCEGCRECLSTSNFTSAKPQLTVECTGLSKVVAKPISVSTSKFNNQSTIPLDGNLMCTHSIQSPVVIKATQQYANKDVSAEEGPIAKPPLVRPAGSVKLPNRSVELKAKSSAIENHPERENLGRSRVVDSMICQRTLSEHMSSSDNLSENAMTPSRMEDFTFSDPGAGSPVMETILTGNDSKLPEGGSRMDDSVLVDDEDLFKYVLATRQIPYGHSYSSLGSSMQRRLHDHFKLACPPCPHCNSNTFVRFRYFNNSGKSSLLQPRYSCRNPHTCAIAQEKNGKTGSRDFTLPKPKEVEAQKALATFTVQEHVDTMIDRAACQPQMIARAGTKRSAQNANLSEAGERSGKLPNTTLSLQTLNEPTTDASNMQVVQVPKTRALQQAGKHIEDSNSSSSIQTVNNEQTAINVRCQAETSSENGRIIVQPISVQKVVPYLGKGEVGTSAEGPSNPRKIAELNICMYIDLSSASQCPST